MAAAHRPWVQATRWFKIPGAPEVQVHSLPQAEADVCLEAEKQALLP
jgi:hypothetical protein